MSAELHIRTNQSPLSWQEFRETHPPYSIALDGYVKDRPEFDPNGPFANMNHHEGVTRLATLSTSQQVLVNIQMGMDEAFTRDGEFSPLVFVNDCDQDVCTAWYLFDNIDEACNPSQALNRFVTYAGVLDATGGTFPYDKDLDIMGRIAWVFEPYNHFRSSGEMRHHDDAQYRHVVDEVCGRLGQHVRGEGGKKEIDIRYASLGGGDDWRMIREIGAMGRVGAINDGANAYVTVQNSGEGRWRYTIGKRSHFISFPVTTILDRLNQVERTIEDEWGGSDIIGGSPRVADSTLSPDIVEEIINQVLAEQKAIRP